MLLARFGELKKSAARAGALIALTWAKAWVPDLDPTDVMNGYPSMKEDGSEFIDADLRALTREMRPLASKLADEADLSRYQAGYDVDNHRVNTPVYEVEDLIPPVRKHTYAPDVEPSELISDEAIFQALTKINWATTDFQLLDENEEETARDDPQPSSRADTEP